MGDQMSLQALCLTILCVRLLVCMDVLKKCMVAPYTAGDMREEAP